MRNALPYRRCVSLNTGICTCCARKLIDLRVLCHVVWWLNLSDFCNLKRLLDIVYFFWLTKYWLQRSWTRGLQWFHWIERKTTPPCCVGWILNANKERVNMLKSENSYRLFIKVFIDCVFRLFNSTWQLAECRHSPFYDICTATTYISTNWRRSSCYGI